MAKLPSKIKVKIVRNLKTGVFLAELPEYDVFTESDSFSGLVFQVNDLIYTFFEVPKKFHGRFIYYPPQGNALEEQKPLPVNPIVFHLLTSQGCSPNVNGII